jgi:hypothetical protein
MKGFSIQPVRQGAYVALCYLDDMFVPLDREEVGRLRRVADAPALEFFAELQQVVGTSSYLRERVSELWAKGDAAEQARRLQDAVTQLPTD